MSATCTIAAGSPLADACPTCGHVGLVHIVTLDAPGHITCSVCTAITELREQAHSMAVQLRTELLRIGLAPALSPAQGGLLTSQPRWQL